MSEQAQSGQPQAIQKSNQHPMVTIGAMLRAREPEFAKALPRGPLTVDRLLRVAMTCLGKTPKLQKCSGSSLVGALFQCAELGLEPGGTLGKAYLVPYGDQCTLIIGYRGLIDLARRSGDLEQIEAHVVYEGDTFELEFGLNPKLRHIPKLTGERGAPRLVYCVARLRGNAVHTEVMTIAEVETIRQRSKSKDDGPWKTDWSQMACKTVVRRAAKYLPLASESDLLAKALEVDDQDFVDGQVIDQAAIVAQGVSRTAEVKERAKARRQIVGVNPAESEKPDGRSPADFPPEAEPPPPGDADVPVGAT